MSAPPLLTLDAIGLTYGSYPLFQDLRLTIAPGERISLVGRNGAGKSTLLKIIAGITEPDQGSRFIQPGTHIAYLQQDPDFSGFATLGGFAAADLTSDTSYLADMMMDGLEVQPGLDPKAASGGEKKRAALARLLAGEPDLMLLDEPTNHLDIKAIEWLEAHLASLKSAYVLISHDRRFLSNLTRATIWLDRGEARRLPQGFAHFEEWRDKTILDERDQRHKLNRLIKAEGRWAVEGISARRKRNMGRVRRLADLRAQRGAQIAEIGRAAMALDSGPTSGKLVIEAKAITKSYDGRTIVAPFSTRIHRGDRIALVGPNGAGKTTLLNMLTGELPPDSGKARLGTNIEMARLDQSRSDLDPGKSLWETMTADKLSRVSGNSDQVMVRGRPQHVVGYLKGFLFEESQTRGPVSALSGGERARLLLAKLMARPSNLLVLDEPTNDLDIETLDLLQELLADYDGTVLLVSHDRDFIDRIATSTIAPDGTGKWIEYAGGWSDYQTQRSSSEPAGTLPRKKPVSPKAQSAARPNSAAKMTFAEEIRLKKLPDEIDRLTNEIEKLESILADSTLFEKDPQKFQQAIDAVTDRRQKLESAENEWLTLEAKREELAS